MDEVTAIACILGPLVWGIYVFFLWRIRKEDEELRDWLDQWARDIYRGNKEE